MVEERYLRIWIILFGLCVIFLASAKSRSVKGKLPKPKNLRLIKVTKTSISITWDSPKNESTIVMEYLVDLSYCYNPSTLDCRVKELIYKVPLKDDGIITISNLTPDMEYTVTVRAYSNGRNSKESNRLRVGAREPEINDFIDAGRRRGISESTCGEVVRQLQEQGYNNKDGMLEELVMKKECNMEETRNFIKQIISISPDCASE